MPDLFTQPDTQLRFDGSTEPVTVDPAVLRAPAPAQPLVGPTFPDALHGAHGPGAVGQGRRYTVYPNITAYDYPGGWVVWDKVEDRACGWFRHEARAREAAEQKNGRDGGGK